MKPAFTIFAYSTFSKGYLHSMRNVPKNSLISGLPLLWLQFKERLQSWHDHKVMKITKAEVVQKLTAHSLIALREMCIPPAAFQADTCIDLCKLLPSERLHSSPGHIFQMSSSVLEITKLLRAGHPVFTLLHLQTPPEFIFCIFAEKLATAVSLTPSHTSFHTGKPPEPLFFPKL